VLGRELGGSSWEMGGPKPVPLTLQPTLLQHSALIRQPPSSRSPRLLIELLLVRQCKGGAMAPLLAASAARCQSATAATKGA
jgi:hypothetical protein